MKKLSCGTYCAKVTLIIFNVFFWLSGCGILALGIWLKVDPSIVQMTSVIQVSMVTDAQFLTLVAWLFIAVGIFVLLVGFFGCCGAVRESRVLLSLYMLCLFLVTAGELAGGVYAAIRREDIEQSMRSHGLQWIRSKYDPPEAASRAFNYMMLEFKCCGINDYHDFESSHFVNVTPPAGNTGFPAGNAGSAAGNASSAAGNAGSAGRYQYALNVTGSRGDLLIPKACCRSGNPDSLLAALQNAEPANETQCTADALTAFNNSSRQGTAEFHAQGCLDSLVTFSKSRLLVIVLVGCLIASIELFGFACALCLCRGIGED